MGAIVAMEKGYDYVIAVVIAQIYFVTSDTIISYNHKSSIRKNSTMYT